MKFNLGESFPSELLLSVICERCVYLELNSQNQNNTEQTKNKYKLCLSSEAVSKTIGGKIFCASCSSHKYLQKGKDHIRVIHDDYEDCCSETLRDHESLYIPKYVEFLSNESLLNKKRDGFSFKYKAKMKFEKFLEIRKAVKQKVYDVSYTKNGSVIKLREAIGLPDMSVLKKYGVKLDETVLADW